MAWGKAQIDAALEEARNRPSWIFTNPADLNVAPNGQSWANFVLDTIRGGQEYDAASPWPERVPLLPWSGDRGETQPFITQYVGEIAPYLSDDYLKDFSADDQELLKGWAAGTKENATHKDNENFFGGSFFPALAALGIIGGATALAGLGAGAAGAGAGAAEAAGAGLGAGAAEAAGTGALGGTIGGYATAASVPELVSGGLGGLAGATAPTIATGAAGAAGAGAAGAGGLLSALGIAAPTTPLGWASLVSSGISGLGSLVGGIQGASAARSAANTQVQSAQNANKLLADIYTQQRSDLAPYQALGTASLGDLMRRLQTNQQTPVQGFNLANYRR